MLYANTVRAQFSADQHFTASTWSDITGQKQITELAIIAPRKIALGQISPAALVMLATWQTPQNTDGKRKKRGEKLS